MFNPFRKTVLTRTVFFVSADIILVAVAVWLAFLVRFDFNVPSQYFPFIYRMIFLSVIFVVPVFYFQKLYSFSWAYVSTSELISLFRATTISFAFLSVVIFLSYYFPRFINFPRSTIILSYIFVFVFCGALRFSKRIYHRVIGQTHRSEKDRTLIVGAGDAGEQILRSILSSGRSQYYPIGFVDDDPMKIGVLIHGLEVLGKISDIPKVVAKKNIRQLIVAFPSANSKVIKDAVELGRKARLKKIKIAPPISEIIRGQISINNLREVDVEDLLNRERVAIDPKQIQSFIKNKIVLITGAAGSIGSELSRQVAKFEPSILLLLDQDETCLFNISKELENNFSNLKFQIIVADIRDKEKIAEIFKRFKPKIVFHAAAYKHVPLMEENPDEAVKNNIFGTKNLVKASLDSGVEKFIFISTDKAVNPSSIMGASKRIGEMICQAHNQKNITKFISVRFGNVLNSRGSVIPIFKEQIKKGGPVQVTHPEMKRYFMLISEACLLVMQAGAMGEGGEVFVLDMGKPVKILDLAREMIRLSGFEPDKDIAIVFTGIRPGEKLFEEILTAEEGTIATQNQSIFKAKLSNVNPAALEAVMEVLKSSLSNKDIIKKKIMEVLKELI